MIGCLHPSQLYPATEAIGIDARTAESGQSTVRW